MIIYFSWIPIELSVIWFCRRELIYLLDGPCFEVLGYETFRCPFIFKIRQLIGLMNENKGNLGL